MKHSFDPKVQETDLTSKLVVGFERLSEVFRVLLWKQAKETGLSPIQIQILLFIHHHESRFANVSHLSKEFNMTKPTVSDAIKSLFEKELISKEVGMDARAYTIHLTDKGLKLTETIKEFDHPLRNSIDQLDFDEQVALYTGMANVIHLLNKAKVIETQRQCLTCKFHEMKEAGHYCAFIKKPLQVHELRLDCVDYVSAD